MGVGAPMPVYLRGCLYLSLQGVGLCWAQLLCFSAPLQTGGKSHLPFPFFPLHFSWQPVSGQAIRPCDGLGFIQLPVLSSPEATFQFSCAMWGAQVQPHRQAWMTYLVSWQADLQA